MTPFRRRRRILLMLFSLGLLLATLLLFLTEHFTAPAPPASSLQDSDISLSRFRHTATEKDRILWTLSADRADYDRQDNMATLRQVVVTYITEKNTPITARSETGFLDTRSKDIHLSKNVRANHLQYHMKSEKLLYTSKSQILVSPVKTRFTSTNLQIESNAASYDIPSGRLRFTGKVKGILHAPEP